MRVAGPVHDCVLVRVWLAVHESLSRNCSDDLLSVLEHLPQTPNTVFAQRQGCIALVSGSI
jgi:hypothetical protein